MEEFDLNDIWNQSENKADDYYNSIKSELMEKAQKKSGNILEKIKRNIKFEWAFSILLGVLVAVYTKDPILIAAYVFLSIIVWLPYRGLLKSIRNTQTQNINECLKSYVEILNTFIKRLKIICIVLFPFSFLLGISIQFKLDDQFIVELLSWKPMIVFPLLFIAIAIGTWGTLAWYITALYDNPKRELEEILKGLNQEIA